jgi:hypothetical protein
LLQPSAHRIRHIGNKEESIEELANCAASAFSRRALRVASKEFTHARSDAYVRKYREVGESSCRFAEPWLAKGRLFTGLRR